MKHWNGRSNDYVCHSSLRLHFLLPLLPPSLLPSHSPPSPLLSPPSLPCLPLPFYLVSLPLSPSLLSPPFSSPSLPPSYIPVLMAQAKIYWDLENYQQVEKIFRKSVEFCSEHDTWKLNVAHVLFMHVSLSIIIWSSGTPLIRTPEMWPPLYSGHFMQIHPWNVATPLIRTLSLVPRVAGPTVYSCVVS